jgi:hypothetical protein
LAEDAEIALAAARGLYPRPGAGVEALRCNLFEARLADRLGQAEHALVLLGTALPDFLAAGAFYDAALAAVDLAQIYAALDRASEVERLAAAAAPLRQPGALPERALSVVLFAFHLASRPGRDATELLADAGEFLERARERPWLRFQVVSEPRLQLPWDLLEPGMRGRLCEQAGVPAEVAGLAASALPAAERDLLSWTQEARAGVRISFAPPAAEERRA